MNNNNYGSSGNNFSPSEQTSGGYYNGTVQNYSRPPQWNYQNTQNQQNQNIYAPGQGYNANPNPQDYYMPPEPRMYAPVPPVAQYYYPPSPEQVLMQEKQNEKKIVRKLGNRTGWAVNVMLVSMTLIFTALCVVFYSGIIGSQSDNLSSLFNAIAAMLSMFLGGFILLALTHTKLSDAVTFKRTKSRKRCAAVFLVGLGAIPLCNLLSQLIANNLTLIGIENKSYGESSTTPEIDLFYIFIQVLCTAIVPAVSEEFLFRGAVMGALKPYGQGFAIVMSSVIFGLIHGNLGQIPFAIAGGMFFAYLAVYSGSLIPSIILHGLNNLLSVILDITMCVYDESITYAILIAYYAIFCVVAIVAFVMLAKRDKDIMQFERPESKITDSQKSRAFIASPGMIVFLVLITLETVSAYLST